MENINKDQFVREMKRQFFDQYENKRDYQSIPDEYIDLWIELYEFDKDIEFVKNTEEMPKSIKNYAVRSKLEYDRKERDKQKFMSSDIKN